MKDVSLIYNKTTLLHYTLLLLHILYIVILLHYNGDEMKSLFSSTVLVLGYSTCL